jgi:hypothetical protein
MATVKDDPREQARQTRDAARRAAAEAEQRFGRASHVTRWGSDDPREEAWAHRNVHDLKVAMLDARDAADAAERAFIVMSHEEAAGHAPAWREHHQAQARAIYDALLEVVRLHDMIEASGHAARKDCCLSGTWAAPQAYDPDLVSVAALVKGTLSSWENRMRRAGWLKD